MLYLLVYVYHRMVYLRRFLHGINPRRRYLLIATLVIATIISLEIVLQAAPEKGKYMAHKNSPELLRAIKEAPDARKARELPVVPRLVHFTWGANPYMRFHQMLSMLSTYHIIRPDKIIIWYCLSQPSGQWWDYLIANVTKSPKGNIISLRFREDPVYVFDRRIRVAEHKSDVIRLDVMRHMGGIYLDSDVFVLKSFDELLFHDVTMGLEDENYLCNGIIIAKPNATLLNVWWEEYRTFNDAQWGHHSVLLPALLTSMYPHLCYVLPRALNRPNWTTKELKLIYGDKKYDWQKHNFAMHLWFRFYNVEHDLESVKSLRSTYGEMCRFILYGHPELMT